MTIRTEQAFDRATEFVQEPTDLFPTDWALQHSDAEGIIRLSRIRETTPSVGAAALEKPNLAMSIANEQKNDNPENHIG
jgi:hypothetical protein